MRAIDRNRGVRPEAFSFAGSTGARSPARGASDSPFSDCEERTLASRLLEVASEAELDEVLRALSAKATPGGEPGATTALQPFERFLKAVAKQALPSIAAAAGGASDLSEGDPAAGRLGALLNRAFSAKAAGKAAGLSVGDPNLKACRELFERCRQFVRLAGKAAKAAAAAPPGVPPVVVAGKALGEAARRALTGAPASAAAAGGPAGGGPSAADARLAREAKAFAPARPSQAARTAPIAAPFSAPAMDSSPRPPRRTSTPAAHEAAAGRVCAICEQPAGVCQCRKIGRTGRWFRDGTNIVLNC